MSTYVKLNRLTTHGTRNVVYFKLSTPPKRPNCGSNCNCGAQTTAASAKSIPGYDYMKYLDEGGFGFVKLYRKRSTGETVAIKSLSYVLNGRCSFREIESEYKIVINIIHPNIARYYGFYTNTDRRMCYIVTEYASRGSLRDLLIQQIETREPFALGTAVRMIRDVLTGVQFLNSKHVLHCDLKPDNILVGENNLLKISDFGLASLHFDVNSNLRGTPAYIAPEQFGGAKPSEKTEIWAIGIITYEIWKLERPFNRYERNGYFEPLHWSFNKELQNLVEIMLQINPMRRGTLSSHLKNRIFQF